MPEELLSLSDFPGKVHFEYTVLVIRGTYLDISKHFRPQNGRRFGASGAFIILRHVGALIFMPMLCSSSSYIAFVSHTSILQNDISNLFEPSHEAQTQAFILSARVCFSKPCVRKFMPISHNQLISPGSPWRRRTWGQYCWRSCGRGWSSVVRSRGYTCHPRRSQRQESYLPFRSGSVLAKPESSISQRFKVVRFLLALMWYLYSAYNPYGLLWHSGYAQCGTPGTEAASSNAGSKPLRPPKPRDPYFRHIYIYTHVGSYIHTYIYIYTHTRS